MNLIILFGPPAVGKMTVGQELSKITGYKLLHNHMTIDLVTEFFDFGTPQFGRLVPAFRQMLVAEAAASDLVGMIFTFVWAFGNEDDKQFLDGLRDSVTECGGSTFYAELEAGIEERLVRNRTENRLKHKKMTDCEKTEAFIVAAQTRYQMNSNETYAVYPDTLFALQELRRREVKVGVLTDVPYGMPHRFVDFDLEPIASYIDVVLTSAEVGYRKPHPRGYLCLAEGLAVEPPAMIYVGNEEKDIVGANDAGLFSVFIDRAGSGADFRQKRTVASLGELILFFTD